MHSSASTSLFKLVEDEAWLISDFSSHAKSSGSDAADRRDSDLTFRIRGAFLRHSVQKVLSQDVHSGVIV